MANLEIQIGADSSELNSELQRVEKQLQTLERRQEIRVRAGLDTGDLDRRITDARTNLDRLRTSMNTAGQGMQGLSRNTANGSNALTQFSRIAQDAPFGIMGIGNNLTSTAEAFAALSRNAGGATGALQAIGTSLMGTGGILLAVSLVTTALTVMSQKGITIGDVFRKLTGDFDEFGAEMKKVSQEAAKSTAEEIFNVKALVSAASDETLSRQKRLTAVKQLQDQYPAYFANLTKEQILNGNVGNSVNEVSKALIAKAKAQALSGKLGELAVKEFDVREREAELIKKVNKYVLEYNKTLAESKTPAGQFDSAVANAAVPVKALKERLAEVQDELKGIFKRRDDIASLGTIEVKKSLDLEYTEPKVPKPKKIKELHDPLSGLNGLKTAGLDSLVKVDTPFSLLTDKMSKDMDAFINRLQSKGPIVSKALMDFFQGMKSIAQNAIPDIFGNLGDALGQALASGTSVVQALGKSLLASLGGILSSIGDQLIALGAASLIASTVFSTFGSALGIGAALAAIAGGVALKAGGSLISTKAKGSTGGGSSSPKVSGGNSFSTPTSSISGGSSFNGNGTVVFEISGQSLIGVLSNTLGKNTKLGGVPAI